MSLPQAIALALVPLLSTMPQRDAAGSRAAHRFLASNFAFGDRAFRDLDRRLPAVLTLDAADNREVATVGAIRIGVPPRFYLEQLQDIVEFKRDEAVLQIGTFSTPSHADDLLALTLEPSDIRRLRGCRPRDCDLQLADEAIERFQRDVAWQAPDAAETANRIMREMLRRLVDDYRSRGDAALVVYGDSARPLSLANEFRAMIESPPAILSRFPTLYRHLVRFPQASDGAVQDIVYWSKERLGPAVVISVTHMALAPLAEHGPVVFAAASKQLYGSRYFDASLGLTLLLEDDAATGPAMYLTYVNRSRVDALGGFFGGLKRLVVRSRARSAMTSSLIKARDGIERRWREQHSAGGARPEAWATADKG